MNTDSDWAKQLVNLNQTSEERQEKYWFARAHDIKPALARSMRDWRMSKIERFLEAHYDSI